MSQKDLARRLGFSQSTISAVERGLRYEPTLRAMQGFFGMKPDLLLRPVPASLNPEAPGEAAKQFGISNLPSPRQANAHGVPAPPSLSEHFRRERE